MVVFIVSIAMYMLQFYPLGSRYKCQLYLCVLYYDQLTRNYFTNYHTPTCLGTIVSSGSL